MFVYQFDYKNLYDWVEDVLTDWTGECDDYEAFLHKRINKLEKVCVEK